MGSCLNTCVYQPQNPLYSNDIDLRQLYSSLGQSIPCQFLDKQTNQIILFSHGNAECIGNTKFWIEHTVFNVMEVSFFLYEYTGYGLSEGTVSISEKILQDNIELAYNYVQQVLGFKEEQIILWGRSLGTGVSCNLASKQKNVGGLILQSSFTSIINTVVNIKGLSIQGDLFRNIDKMHLIKCPVLLLHAEDDRITPFNHAVENQEAIKHDQKWLVRFAKGGHNDLEDENRMQFFSNVYWFVQMLDNTAKLVNHTFLYFDDVDVKRDNLRLVGTKANLKEKKRLPRVIDEYQLNL